MKNKGQEKKEIEKKIPIFDGELIGKRIQLTRKKRYNEDKERYEKFSSADKFGEFLNNKYKHLQMGDLRMRKIESGNAMITFDELFAIADALNVDVDFLLTIIDEEKRSVRELKEITGLSTTACERIIEYTSIDSEFDGFEELIERLDDAGVLYEIVTQDLDERLECLSWFLKEDMLFIFESLISLVDSYMSTNKNAPKFINVVRQQDGTKITYGRKVEEELFLWRISQIEKHFSDLIKEYVEKRFKEREV